MRIILGLIILIVGAIMVLKSETLLRTIGPIGFFERHLGTEGGSRLGYKLLGMLITLIGVMIMTNMIGGVVLWILSPFLRLMGAPASI